jgi:hypothetical protein
MRPAFFLQDSHVCCLSGVYLLNMIFRTAFVCAFALVTCLAVPVWGQQCPKEDAKGFTPSEVRTLEGKLVYHDGIRKWFELKLDAPQCGQASIELVRMDNWRLLEILRGCHVRTVGVIDNSPTGYYSLDLYQDVTKIEPVGACARQKPFPDYLKAKPDASVQSYRVEMTIHYGQEDSPILFRVTHAGRVLQPWQAYASYWFTGGFVLYGQCGKGFVVDRVFGTPEAHPSHFTESRDSSDSELTACN